jgi:hypothetical protein
MKFILTFSALTLLFAASSSAQVSCSAKVPAETCKMVADAFEFHLPPVEVVTPDEFKQRMAAFDEDEGKNAREVDLACTGKDNFKTERCQILLNTFFTNVIGMGHSRLFLNTFNRNVAFVRDTPKSRSPDRIVLSTDGIDEYKETCEKDDKGQTQCKLLIVHGQVSHDRLYSVLTFIIGFINGIQSTLLS